MPSLLNMPTVLAAGFAGILMVYAVYRRFTKRTAHDLRSEVRAEQEAVRATIEALPAQIDRAKRSLAADATGNTGAEGLQQGLSELDLDLSEAELLRSQLSAAESEHKVLSDMEVEIKLVEVLGLSLRASTLADKYRASVAVQEADAESLTDDVEALLQETARHSIQRSSVRESVR